MSHILVHQVHHPHQIIHKKQVAHLLAVAIDRDGLAFQGLPQKMGNPALVFRAQLVGSINAAHTEDAGSEAIRVRVIEHVLVRTAFRASVWRQELERLTLVHARTSERFVNRLISAPTFADGNGVQPPIDFIRGSKKNRTAGVGFAHRLKQMQRTHQVRSNIAQGILEAGSHRYLRREMVDRACAFDCLIRPACGLARQHR